MRMMPDGRWLAFTAVAYYNVRRVAFSCAKFPIGPMAAWLTVVDAYEEDSGRMDRRVWDVVPFMFARAADIERG